MKKKKANFFKSTLIHVLAIGLLGCKNTPREIPTIEIKTYSQDELDYPDAVVDITDSSKAAFLENFFLPWDKSSEQLISSLDSFPGKDLSYLQDYLIDDTWYGENKKPHKKFLRKEIVRNVIFENFPNFQRKGLVITHTNLRRIPSHKPGFDTYSKAGEGFPFDYFQETNLWANTPLQLLHLTNDKQWCYVVSPYYKGWVPMHDLAIVSEEFMDKWRTGNYAMPISDGVHLGNDDSIASINAKVGMVLPIMETDDSGQITVLYTNSDELEMAKIMTAKVPRNRLALDDFEFNGEHLEGLVSNLIGRPYGWGGNLGHRDCSSMIRDFMATYQIWLPRDSKDQIDIGKRYELTGSLEEKMEHIKAKGIPFRTILRKKGHNMLYVGDNENGEPLIFHAIWGLKTTYNDKNLAYYLKKYPIEGVHQDKDGSFKGRHIIGESVITSVLAGSESNGLTVPLLDEIYAMTTLLVD